MKTIDKNYWDGRKTSRSIFTPLKRFSILRYLFSVRAGDEAFLNDELVNDPPLSILDVACGAGKDVLVQHAQAVTGIDISGYPQEIAKSRGYKNTLIWGRGFEIPTTESFDVVTIINLNAHISFPMMNDILNSVKKHTKNKAKIIFINEYDNSNFLFRLMKKINPKGFARYVNGCEHFYFHTEQEFINFMDGHQEFKLIKSKVIAADPPFSHFLAIYGVNDRNVLVRILCILIDMVISLINNISHHDTGFQVSHVYEYYRGEIT